MAIENDGGPLGGYRGCWRHKGLLPTRPFACGYVHYELRIGGKLFVIDTGISTYEKTARRQYERGTAAHNTVMIGDKNSSEVWGGFRVGRRARVTLLKDSPNEVEAWHDGFGSLGRHRRKFTIDKDFLG